MEKGLVGLVFDMVRLSWSLGALMVGYCSGVGQMMIGGGPRLLNYFPRLLLDRGDRWGRKGLLDFGGGAGRNSKLKEMERIGRSFGTFGL